MAQIPAPEYLLTMNRFPGDGVTTIFNFVFTGGYLARDHVKAYIADAETRVVKRTQIVTNDDFIGPYQLRILPAVAADEILVIYRDTPKDEPLVDFTDGAILNEINLDKNAKQAVFLAAEAFDRVSTAVVDSTAAAVAALAAAERAEAAAILAETVVGNIGQQYLSWRNQYQGPKAAAPTLRPDGTDLQQGDLYFDTTRQSLRVWGTQGWQSVIQGQLKRPQGNVPLIATAGQTTFPIVGGFDPGYGMVFLNGVQIAPPAINLSSGTQIVFTEPLSAGDEVDYLFFGAFDIVNIPAQSADNVVYGDSFNYAPGTIGYEVKNGGAILASRIGVKGDGVTDNSSLILAGCVLSSYAGREFVVDLHNVGVLTVPIVSLTKWKMRVAGSLVSLAAKPAGTGVDAKDTHGLQAPVLKITSCEDFHLSGSYINPRFREAWSFVQCKRFTNHLDVLGDGVNDNLVGGLYRYCEDFRFGQTIRQATLKLEVGYHTWLNATTVWDCTKFTVTSAYKALDNGANGLYIGSNCTDWVIEPGAQCSRNGMSGIQLAWSSFGTFPQRFSIGAVILTDNRADGLDINSTDVSAGVWPIHASIVGIQSHRNGYEFNGSVSPDGSGIGTFMNVSHFDIVGGDTVGSARAGLYLKNCTDFTAKGFNIDKALPPQNVGEGVYLERCARYTVDGRVKMAPDREAIKTYGIHSHGTISGNYDGIIALSTPDLNTTYTNVVLDNAFFVTVPSVVCPLPIRGGGIRASQTAIYALKNVENCEIHSETGYGLIYAAPGVKVRGGRIFGLNGGTNCTEQAYCSQIEVDVSGTNGPASHWINCAYPKVAGNTITALGGANSLRIEANCTRVWKEGNLLSGPDAILPAAGQFDMNT